MLSVSFYYSMYYTNTLYLSTQTHTHTLSSFIPCSEDSVDSSGRLVFDCIYTSSVLYSVGSC